jgi:hypothetical protein
MPVQRSSPLDLIRPCTAAEVRTHRTYLARTAKECGGWLPQQATPGLYEWFKASVFGLANIAPAAAGDIVKEAGRSKVVGRS